jgi:phage baseplate assembly protein V
MTWIAKALAPIRNQVRNMIVRGLVTLVDDAKKCQEVQASLLADETQDGLERLQNYGLTASPPVGAECLVVFLAGQREHGVVLAAESRDIRRQALDNVATVTGVPAAPGDVLLYSSNDNFVLMRASTGNIIVNSPKTIRLNAKNIEFHAIEKIKLDVSGRGIDYLPTNQINWVVGSVPDVPANITPTEHPGSPAT